MIVRVSSKILSLAKGWVENPDIEKLCKMLALEATGTQDTAFPPMAIHDPSTGIYQASRIIAHRSVLGKAVS